MTPPTLSKTLSHADYAKLTLPKGKFWLPTCTPRCEVTRAILKGLVYDAEVVDALRPYIRTGTTVVDLGCCFGQMSILFAEMVGAGGEVIAVESSPFNYRLARLNFADYASGRGKIRLYRRAAFDQSDRRLKCQVHDLVKDASFAVAGVAKKGHGFCDVMSVTVDDIPIRKTVSAMKIDVQGSDLLAMRGARKTIEKYRMPIVFEYEKDRQAAFGLTWEDNERFIDEIGYRIVRTVKDAVNFLIASKPLVRR